MSAALAPLVRLLLVDDNEDDRTLVRRELARAYPQLQVIEARDEKEFQGALDQGAADLVITDYQLRWSDGLKVLDAVKRRFPDCLVIMFTGTGTQEVAVEAMKHGLDDYLIKAPAHFVRLPPAVAAALERRSQRIAKRQAAEDLHKALAEKDLLLRELYHRVKNNMQIISSILDLQAANIREPAVLETFRIGQARIRAMALVHEKLYQAKDLTHISFSEYVQDLVAELFSSYGVGPDRIHLKLDVDIDADVVPVDTAVPCGMIVNELLSNSVKYAFPHGRSGEVRVGLRPLAGGPYQLVVADNGIGLPNDFDLAEAQTLGLRLVYSLCREQLKGAVDTTFTRSGTQFRITFPLRGRVTRTAGKSQI
jgi:two-component sensor histidine kinase/CheY-like chemotaxis protein